MIRTIQDFLTNWKHESDATLKIFNTLTDESLNQKVYEEGRTLGKLAWHLVGTIEEMIGKTGLQFSSTPHDAPQPKIAKEIAEAYKKSSDAMVQAIKEQWTDETLLEEKDMYGEVWTVATVLQILLFHQAHHRGQITVLMRQAGLTVPGMYGPSKEEWLAFSGEAPE
ncbi:DinB family protein [Bacillus sp. FJAT-22090]|uniref:DinB family protein n=1 Tax=Bacillus sp. FJAT-22090 TaxID=1581038 RepID=UPI0011A3F591|nr:DinB family protein [Bacillus sp. FJAT-22090]